MSDSSFIHTRYFRATSRKKSNSTSGSESPSPTSPAPPKTRHRKTVWWPRKPGDTTDVTTDVNHNSSDWNHNYSSTEDYGQHHHGATRTKEQKSPTKKHWQNGYSHHLTPSSNGFTASTSSYYGHDCQENWFVQNGHGMLVNDGRRYSQPGGYWPYGSRQYYHDYHQQNLPGNGYPYGGGSQPSLYHVNPYPGSHSLDYHYNSTGGWSPYFATRLVYFYLCRFTPCAAVVWVCLNMTETCLGKHGRPCGNDKLKKNFRS